MYSEITLSYKSFRFLISIEFKRIRIYKKMFLMRIQGNNCTHAKVYNWIKSN